MLELNAHLFADSATFSITLNRLTEEHIVAIHLEVFHCKVGERKPTLLSKIKWSTKGSCWLGGKMYLRNTEFNETFPN